MKFNTKKIIVLIVLGMSFVFLPNIKFDFGEGQKNSVINPRASGGYSRSFIHVDDNWTTTESTYDWCYGSGTWQEPYVIENVTIDSGGTGSGIFIENSDTDYFIIRNCTVYNSGSVWEDAGIKLANTNNGTLTFNNCSNTNAVGIFFIDSNNNIVSGNIAKINDYGILFMNSHYNNITGNTAKNNIYYGIYIDTCKNNIISGNTANNNDYDGIIISNCNNNTISGNTANDNTDDGIGLIDSNNNIISGNTACNNETSSQNIGIGLNSCNNNTISGNIAYNNAQYGIYLVTNCNNNTISGNTANNNTYCGISLDGNGGFLKNNLISENTANNNTNFGIYFEYCDNNTISGNTANENSQHGIYFYHYCDNNTISGNTANDNDEFGMYLQSSDNNTISGNIVNGNLLGILIKMMCDENTISGNTANNNDYYGIYFDGFDKYNIISGNTASNNTYTGIHFEGINNDDNTISGNILSDNKYGINIGTSVNNTIYENFFLKNGIHAMDNGTDNKWNSTTIGNYWDNWTSPDVDLDGIVDDEYTNITGTTGGIDYLPIAEDGAPSITINSPGPGDVFDSTAPSFNVRIIDDYLDVMWYTLDGGLHNYTFIANDTIHQSVWDALSEGSVTITFYASDIPGNIGSSEVMITKDYETPTIQINSPDSGNVFGVTAPSFNVRITDDYLDSMWYTLDGGLNNYTFTVNGTLDSSAWNAVADGAVILKFYANDTLSHIGSAEVSIIKDTTAPIIVITSPVDDEEFGTQAPLFNIMITDDNLDSIWYSLDGGLTTHAITTNGTIDQTAWAALAQGDVTITFYARDLAGHESSESVTVIKSIPAGGLDPGIIITIVIISIVGGVALVVVVYVFIKKRATPA